VILSSSTRVAEHRATAPRLRQAARAKLERFNLAQAMRDGFAVLFWIAFAALFACSIAGALFILVAAMVGGLGSLVIFGLLFL
jgi:hypothetical protein